MARPIKTQQDVDAETQATIARFNKLPDEAYVRVRHVAALYGISTATVWRHAGKSIPAPEHITPRLAAWRVGALRRARNGNV